MTPSPGSDPLQRPNLWRYLHWPSFAFNFFAFALFVVSFIWGHSIARFLGVDKNAPLAVGTCLMLISTVLMMRFDNITRDRVRDDWPKVSQTDEMEYDLSKLGAMAASYGETSNFQSAFSTFASMAMLVGLVWKKPLTDLLWGSELLVFILTVGPTSISLPFLYKGLKKQLAQNKELRTELKNITAATEGVRRRRDL